jgi:hypothetical protein
LENAEHVPLVSSGVIVRRLAAKRTLEDGGSGPVGGKAGPEGSTDGLRL